MGRLRASGDGPRYEDRLRPGARVEVAAVKREERARHRPAYRGRARLACACAFVAASFITSPGSPALSAPVAPVSSSAPEVLVHRVDVGPQTLTLRLTPVRLRAPSFEVLVQRADGTLVPRSVRPPRRTSAPSTIVAAGWRSRIAAATASSADSCAKRCRRTPRSTWSTAPGPDHPRRLRPARNDHDANGDRVQLLGVARRTQLGAELLSHLRRAGQLHPARGRRQRHPRLVHVCRDRRHRAAGDRHGAGARRSLASRRCSRRSRATVGRGGRAHRWSSRVAPTAGRGGRAHRWSRRSRPPLVEEVALPTVGRGGRAHRWSSRSRPPLVEEDARHRWSRRTRTTAGRGGRATTAGRGGRAHRWSRRSPCAGRRGRDHRWSRRSLCDRHETPLPAACGPLWAGSPVYEGRGCSPSLVDGAVPAALPGLSVV